MKSFSTNQILTAGAIGLGAYFLLRSSRGASQEEIESASNILQNPQAANWIQNNPPPPLNIGFQQTTPGGGTPLQNWGQVFNIAMKGIIGPALANFTLPAGTPDVVAQLWEGILKDRVMFPGNPFSKDNIDKFLSFNAGSLTVGTQSFLDTLFK